jgi:hypothetical protein
LFFAFLPDHLEEVTQASFSDLIFLLHNQLPKKLNKILFKFERSSEAATHNATILELNDHSLEKAILSMHSSILSYGSEFKHSSDLEELLCHHPFCPQLKDILTNGATSPLRDMSEKDRLTDIKYHLS